jgi:VanZ family protein
MLAFIFYATLTPIEARPTISTSATYEHFAAFLVLGILFALAYPRRPILVGLVVFGTAFLLEASQLLTPDRHARFADFLEKAAGGALGIVGVWIVAQFLAIGTRPSEPN